MWATRERRPSAESCHSRVYESNRCRLDATSSLACAGRAPGRPRGRPRISPSAVLNSPQMCCPLRGKNTNGDRCRSGPSSLAARLRAVLEGFWCVPIGGTVTQQSACTIDCTTAACPADSACVDGQEVLPTDGGSRRTRFCAPMCATDGDCEDAKCPAPGSLAPFSPGWCRKLPQ